MRPTIDTERNRRALAGILDLLDADGAGGAVLVAVTGPAGIGRSTLVGQLGQALSDRGTRTLVLRPTPMPLAGNPDTTTLTIDRFVSAGAGVVLIDDAQWLAQPCLAALEQLVRRGASGGVRWVCALPLPPPRAATAVLGSLFERLAGDGLVCSVALRPLGYADVAGLTATAVEGRPGPALVRHLRRLSGGRPVAVLAAIEEYRRQDAIKIVAGWAHLAPRHDPPTLPDTNVLLLDVLRQGAAAWSVAKAISVLYPLGEAAPDLIGAALDMTVPAVRRTLDTLCATGVLRRVRGGGWRFRVPLLAFALAASLGPYERRHLAQRAVTALWRGIAHCADPDHLADQLAIAGKLVDPVRARQELLDHADAAPQPSGRAERWLRAAAELATDHMDRTGIQLSRAELALRHGVPDDCLRIVDQVRRDIGGRLSDDTVRELAQIRVLAAHAAGDAATVREIAAETDPRYAMARATALVLLGSWQDGASLLTATRPAWERSRQAYAGHLVLARIRLFTGAPGPVRQSLDEAFRRLPPDAERHRSDLVGFEVLAALVTADPGSAEKVLLDRAVPAEALPLPTQAILAMRQGRFDQALELVRQAIASGVVLGHDPVHTFLYEAAATIQLSRGMLTHARDFVLSARRLEPPLPYLLDEVEARIDRALGEPDTARHRLRDGLADASRRGLVTATDRLWRQLAEIELACGDPASARRCLDEIDRVVELTGTAGAKTHQALVRALVTDDRAAADDALRLARERGVLFEYADVAAALVARGLADPLLLTQCYEILDETGALLHRSWLRTLMQDNGVAVPGRQRTLAENERLLAVLVAEGLGNKQLATVLRHSQKSVESRLTRLFSRTGSRSRVDLAIAVLTGAYPEP